MSRIPYLLIVLLYLLGQAGGLAHAFEAPEACHGCEDLASMPRLECGDEECGESSHHHHRHHTHPPGACRACASLSCAPVEIADLPDGSRALPCAFAVLAAATEPVGSIVGSPRAPPGA